MRYLYVGYYVDEVIFNKIVEKKINNMSVARQKFEYNLIRGLNEQLGSDIDFVSYVPTNSELNIPNRSSIEEASIRHIPIEKGSIKSIFLAGKKFEKYLLDICKQNENGLCVIMYAVNPVFEYYLLKYKKKYDIKSVTICSEVPELRRYGNSFFSKIKRKVFTWFNEQFDGYIFFSAEMRKIVRYRNKPYIVLEGIAPDIRKEPTGGKKNILMYAGGLAEDNAIPFLLECCREIPELHEVWICGVGPDAEIVKDLASKDPKIRYFGRVNNEKVLEMEESAKILVNFRSPNEKLTKYSFPSKILEYIASGSLVLSTRLLGIPEEYFDYIVPVEQSDKEKVKAVIRSNLLLKDEQYVTYCEAAQKFIKKKNYYFQSKKIVDFLTNL